MGYTGLAFLLFQISALRPGLEILGHDLTYWTKRYMEGERNGVGCFTVDKEQGRGLLNEQLCFQALKACMSKEHTDVLAFLSNMPKVLGPYSTEQGDSYETELLYGRTGVCICYGCCVAGSPGAHRALRSP